MSDPVEPERTPRGSLAGRAAWGLVGAVIGGPGAVILVAWLCSVYFSVWDPRPESSYGYGDPVAGLDTALLYGGIVFLLGGIAGGFVAVKLARRVMFARWKNETQSLSRPGKANH